MGCKLSVSVVHPESIVNRIKETMSPSKKNRKMSDPDIKIAPDPDIKIAPDDRLSTRSEIPASPDSVDTYKTIYLDSP